VLGDVTNDLEYGKPESRRFPIALSLRIRGRRTKRGLVGTPVKDMSPWLGRGERINEVKSDTSRSGRLELDRRLTRELYIFLQPRCSSRFVERLPDAQSAPYLGEDDVWDPHRAWVCSTLSPNVADWLYKRPTSQVECEAG